MRLVVVLEQNPHVQILTLLQEGYELLEELLTYDDIFLDFFNAFLALPAFPLRLQYDRLTGRLQELDGFLLESPSHLAEEASSSYYGATDAERERALSWLAQERFLPFQRTVYYLEYKLAKLLVCPLDENYPVNRYAIRGYSRQSDSTAVSSIPSFPSTNQASPGMRRDDLLRCPSQTRSTPAYLGRFTKSSGQMSLDVFLELSDILSFGQSQFEEHPSRFQHSRLRPDTGIEKRNGSSWTNADEQVISSVHLSKTESNQEVIEFRNNSNYEKSLSGRRQVLQFDLTETSISKEEQQDTCCPSGSGSAALQQLKEDVLGTRAGMEDFMEFLHNTLGSHLLNFWIDCEDIMDCTRHLETTVSPQETQLFFSSAFRDIQAKYRLAVPPAFQEQLEESVGEEETAFASLSRKQYDALRRLRSYWVPRFLIHYQRIRQLRFEPSSEVPIEEELSWSGGFPFSLPMLPVMDDQKDMMNYMKRNKDWKMMKSRKGTGSNRTLSSLNDSFETLTTIRFLEALRCDLGDGDGFLHYLTRFEDPQKINHLLLWKKLKCYENEQENQANPSEVQNIAWQIFHMFLASYTECNSELSSSMLDYIQHLERILSTGSGDLTFSAFQPMIQYVLPILGEAWLHYVRHEVTTFLEYCVPISHLDVQNPESKDHRSNQERIGRIKKQKPNTYIHGSKERGLHRKGGKKVVVSKSPTGVISKSPSISSTNQGSREKSPVLQDSPIPQNVPDFLSNPVILNVYKKAACKMQNIELQMVLGLLQEAEACLEVPAHEKHLNCAVKFLDMWNKLGVLRSSIPFSKELKKKIKEEVAQGEITDVTWNEIQILLHSLVVPTFEQFWDEMSEGLKKYGLVPSQIPEERWCKLEPFLNVIAGKVALRHIRNREAQDASAATAKPTREDKDSFWQSLEEAAEGWPTVEMLHFIKHLQVYGTPVLESGLHFLLEVQKFKNAHHDWPDMTLLKKKVLVIRDCFLASQVEPQLQVAVDNKRLGRAIRAAEQALQKEIPPPSLFDSLKDSVSSMLMPYWAAFQKHWLKRSVASAQRVPVLRNQLLLQKRQARLNESPGSLRLPSLQQPKDGDGSKLQDGFIYSFSVSEGLIVQNPNKDILNISSAVFRSMSKPNGFEFPSLPMYQC
ncbi:Regulator of G-protein signaling 22, partial [Ophiophagus hannah]